LEETKNKRGDRKKGRWGGKKTIKRKYKSQRGNMLRDTEITQRERSKARGGKKLSHWLNGIKLTTEVIKKQNWFGWDI